MEVEMQQPEFAETKSPEAGMPNMNNQTGTITKIQPTAQSQEQWLKYGEQVSGFLALLPEYLGSFFNRYKQPLVTIGLIIAALVSVKVVLAVLDALNGIPLVAPTFELIGMGYSVWFVYRYLLKASTRQELTGEIATLKSQVVGKTTSENNVD
ncbi:MAG: CAAD domain-containing protein [Scytonema sp. PMC 1069.18]|nr:CAAD domain-containing protein [Scytonema sp. PMC 1069.18]MEC4881589.1 CAAD domain-containing protein [Scytonema sp. PMC 1070.18]